ncbi:MAG: IS1595 family transposase [Patescibacteria group bacterium]
MHLLDFQKMFRDEEACLRYLEKLRWPLGFVCEKCSASSEPIRIATRPRVLKCRSCLYQSSVTAGTVMHRSKTNIHVWFWAAYLIATQTPGVSALELQKRLGITRYETAFQLLHKLRAAMIRPDRDKIGAEWPLEMDIIYLGGKTRSGIQGKTNQKPAIMAVEIRRKEVRDPKTGKIIKRALAGRVRLQKIQNKSADSIDAFAKECIAPGAKIVSDDGTEFTNLRSLGYDHRPVPMRGDKEKMDLYLPMISRVTTNLKTWIDGTFHGVRKQHLQAYLNEFMFRFNRRFYRAISFQKLLDLGTLRAGQTYRETYAAAGPEISAST